MATDAAASGALSPTKLDRQKQDRVRELRKALCIRREYPETKNLIDSAGNLNKAYFSVQTVKEERKWTADDADRLKTGIQKFGVGRFADIQRELLPDWSTKLLTVKTMRLLGSRDLKRYRGWRGTPELIAREFEKNKKTGLEHGSWHNGVIDETKPKTSQPATADKEVESEGSDKDFQR